MDSVGRCLGFPIMGFMMLLALVQLTNAQAPSLAPIPGNDSTTIDQGIAYVLLLLALAITYLVH